MNKQFIIGTIEGGKAQLLGTFGAVPDDKLTWRPLDQGRSALDLAGDAAQVPLMVMGIMQMQPGGEMPPLRAMFAEMREARQSWTREDVLHHLEANHAAMIGAISQLSDEELARPIALPMGAEGGMTLPLAGWLMMAYRSYIARFAQINYIQTLYGDTDSH
jgi:hypothetical protein